MIVGIHHVALSVPNIDEARYFYTEVIGFEDLGGSEWAGDNAAADGVIGIPGTAAKACMLKMGNVHIELWEYAHPAPMPLDTSYPPSDHGIAHFCLQVVDIEAEFDRLTKAGMSFVGRPQDIGPLRAVYGRDPFGHIVEILEVRQDG